MKKEEKLEIRIKGQVKEARVTTLEMNQKSRYLIVVLHKEGRHGTKTSNARG